jgi:hypothetical protein
LPGSAAYRRYVQRHLRIRRLVAEVAVLPTDSSRELAYRAIAVLIVAEFEAYLRNVLQDHIDSVAGAWDDMAPAQRMVVAAQILGELSKLTQDGIDQVRQPKDADRVAERVRQVSGWLETPGQFAREGLDARLGSFHSSDNVSKTVERVLLLMREDGVPFFDWLGSHGFDQESYKLALRGLVELRGDVAHQLGHELRPTDVELRAHQRRLALMAWSIRPYVRGVPLRVR